MYVYILFGIPVAVLFLCMIIIKITCGRTETYYKMWHFILFRQTRLHIVCTLCAQFYMCAHYVHNSTCVHIMCIILHAVCTLCA